MTPPGEYLTRGSSSPLGYCRICLAQNCSEHLPHLLYPAHPGSIITEMQLDEISIVARPAMPDARINRQGVSLESLQAGLGHDFTPGVQVRCERCLGECDGLMQMQGPARRPHPDARPSATASSRCKAQKGFS